MGSKQAEPETILTPIDTRLEPLPDGGMGFLPKKIPEWTWPRPDPGNSKRHNAKNP